MANDADAVRKKLHARGYHTAKDHGRGKTSWLVTDPATGRVIARIPVNPKPGSWYANLLAGIRRYERTGVAPRSNRRVT